MEKYSDKEIIQGLKNRKSEIIYFIKKRYLRMVISIIEKKNGNYHDAQDVMQEALLGCIVIVDKPEFKLGSSFATLFYAISKTKWMNRLRTTERENRKVENYGKTINKIEFEDNYEEASLENKVLHYFEKLSVVCKKIIRLYSDNCSVKEISKELGNTEKYIRKRKYECKKRLFKLIEENIDRI